jgi:hypothetical protein
VYLVKIIMLLIGQAVGPSFHLLLDVFANSTPSY